MGTNEFNKVVIANKTPSVLYKNKKFSSRNNILHRKCLHQNISLPAVKKASHFDIKTIIIRE